MSEASSFPMRFSGQVICQCDAAGPMGLILRGETEDRSGERVEVAFAGKAPLDLPEVLETVRVESNGLRSYRLGSGSREWTVEGIAHIHRDVGAKFYDTIPGRAVPWRKRFFWRIALALARRPWARALLMK